LRGFCKCSHIIEYAALSKTPRALADGLMLVFQHPVRPDISRVEVAAAALKGRGDKTEFDTGRITS